MIDLLADGSAARGRNRSDNFTHTFATNIRAPSSSTIVGGFSPPIDQKGLPVKLGDFPKFRGENFIGF